MYEFRDTITLISDLIAKSPLPWPARYIPRAAYCVASLSVTRSKYYRAILGIASRLACVLSLVCGVSNSELLSDGRRSTVT